MRTFQNYAGVVDIEDNLTSELNLSGIEVVKLPVTTGGEVNTPIIGSLRGWEFRRAWYYWIARGPGIPCDVAMMLWHKDKTARVDGHCASPSPLEWFKGFGVGHYHVDTPEGLKALADTINLVNRAQ